MRQPSLSTTLPVDPSHASSSTAPFRDYPQQSLASVEYPGPVSHPSALLKVIPQEDLNECFNAPPSESKTLEMSYRREDRYGVPVRGTRVASQKLLLKIVKRRRKRMDGMEVDGQEGRRQGKGKERDLSPVDGVFTAEIMGPVTQTVRFRGKLRSASEELS